MQLLLSNNAVSGPLTLDLSPYLNVQEGQGMDPADPQFTQKVWGRSLLKEGATLALEQLTEKELMFPLLLNQPNSTALAQLIQQINEIVQTPGATASWSDDGVTQPTVFDLLSGQFDIDYSYRKAQKFWTPGKLRLFSQPLGRTAGPRAWAAASAPGPLLMITPYASSGQQLIGASTQAGTAGFGGAPTGASSGLFYPGTPSLAGDASALLQLAYTAGPNGTTPSMTAVSLLPDGTYWPLPPLTQSAGNTIGGSVPGGTVHSFPTTAPSALSFYPAGKLNGWPRTPPAAWAGNHRLLAIARATSGGPHLLYPNLSQNVSMPYPASVTGSTWALYDLGWFSLRPSEMASQPVSVGASVSTGGQLDVGPLIMLPDTTTWFYPGQTITPGLGNIQLLDDVVGDQFTLVVPLSTAPSPASLTAVPSNAGNLPVRISQYSRGLPPRPDPKNGLPAICVLGAIPQSFPGYLMSAQVAALERTRYILG